MSKNMFIPFSKASREEWVAKATKDLRGKSLEDLVSITRDGIAIQPFYSAEDLNGTGESQPRKSALAWSMIQEILVMDEVSANAKALSDLDRGASGLLFYLLPNVDLEVLLKDILLEHIQIHFVTEGNGKEILNKLSRIVEQRGLDRSSISGSINIDALENIARTGNWFQGEEEDFKEIKEITQTNFPNLKTICINANLYGNAGATSVQQLGIALAHAHEYLLKFGEKSIPKFWFNWSVGSQYFEEIAKFRAARRLWALLLDEYGAEQQEMHIYAESGTRNKTIFDPWVNMLRTTTEGMSAVLGGANELNLKAFDTTYAESDVFGERIARNQQLLFHFESYLDKIGDPSAGSYFIENLTDKIARKAWEVFKAIEEDGGYLAALKSGKIQAMVHESADKEQALFNEGKLELLGTNLYPNIEEKMKDKITYPMFYKPSSNKTIVEPIKVQRLSEKLEQERLDSEK